MNKIPLNWMREDKGEIKANLLGYATFNSMMKKYSEQYFDYTQDANITISLTPADHFVPIMGKKNILFTMWEGLNIPDSYKKNINKADLIIVPSKFCKDVFKPYTDVPIEVCWLGIEPERFPFYQRKASYNGKFRMLWLGAPNPRKGYNSIMELAKIFENMPEFEIYMKTTFFKKSTPVEFVIVTWRKILRILKNLKDKDIVEKEWERLKLSFKKQFNPYVANTIKFWGKNKNIIIDTRKLPFDELMGLYNSAHVFLSPHSGEGWNLPLCEAMATGLPSIATGASGCMDFFNEDVGYPIKYEVMEADLDNYDLKAKIFVPDTEDLFRRVIEVYRNYGAALRKGARASSRIHSKFTWDRSGKRLHEIIEKHFGEVKP